LDLDRAVFHTTGIRTLVITSGVGRDRLLRAGAGGLQSTQIRALSAGEEEADLGAILVLLKNEFGVELLLHEGGPTLLGHFWSAALVDELFLTMSPQIAGRTGEHRRLGLVADTQFVPDTAPWLDLVSAKQESSHLFLRYRTKEAREWAHIES
jgi:riboflavin biosynthesis pyrimidine reductase